MATAQKVTNLSVVKISESGHNVYAQWKFSKNSNTENYELNWEYSTGAYIKDKKGKTTTQLRWIDTGSISSVTPAAASVGGGWYRLAYTAPEEAKLVRVKVRAVPKKKQQKDKNGKTKEVNVFTPGWSSYVSHDFRNDKIAKPTVTAELGDNGVTATVTVHCADIDVEYCDVYAYSDSKCTKTAKKYDNKVCTGESTHTFTITQGATWWFRARCQTVKKNGAKGQSDWSAAVSLKAKPGQVEKPTGKATSETSIRVEWKAVKGAETYTVDYLALKPSDTYEAGDFNRMADAITSTPDIHGTSFEPTNLAQGFKYYFRVRAVNSSGEGAWSLASGNVVLATIPEAPTTYDTAAAVLKDDGPVRFRWTHNSEDGSEQSYAQVEINGANITIASSDEYLEHGFGGLADSTVVNWRVRTKGAHPSWSDWSVTRTFTVYERPTLICALGSQTDGAVDDEDAPLTTYPLQVELDASGGGNAVSGYHVAIVAAASSSYTGIDGQTEWLSAGEVVFEKDYPVSDDPYTASIGVEAGLRDVTRYTVQAEVSMQSGLRAKADEQTFLADFENNVPEPTAIVAFFGDGLYADIYPACYKLDEDGEETEDLAEGVTLSVYRINADGSLTLLDEDLANDGSVVVSDPHASFGRCEYRIVATETGTGMLNWTDAWDESVHSTCVIQWDESWNTLVDADDDGEGGYDYSGMAIAGLYNLDFSESASVQAEDIEYIGREYPVSYYGTQKGYTVRYQVEFPKDEDVADGDMSTMDKARRLMAWRDDVYIREPSGTGFWAHVNSADLSRSYSSGAISLTISATRVARTDEALRR